MNTEHLIQARYEVLMKEKEVSESGDNQAESSLLNKDMDGALDSFDNLFCRRCLVSPAKFWNGYYFDTLARIYLPLTVLYLCRCLIAGCTGVRRILYFL